MKKHVLLAISILFIAGIAFAQEKKEEKTGDKKTYSQKGVLLNTTLSSLTEPEGGPTWGLEYRLSESVAIGAEVTAVLYTFYDSYEEDRRGFRIRPEIKIFPSWWRNQHRSFYLSLMGTYKKTSYEDIHYVMPYPNVEPLPQKYEKSVYAGSANIGLQRYFGAKGRVVMDMYVGVGLRHRRTTPNESYYTESWGRPFFRIDEDGFNPQFAFGFKLGYRF
ncbi:hypothetical protein [Chitinophaga pinensis]|uniref:DUF3575 domain-containing protein n=1 Tax=Chitinophaga pinensis (strain ATCC 43595 / DSM 2588 / LMG 13176 / NBRC 15968 / NCIMB 11800 / UQM 2034) TaxID=485918 RepID=A0A979GAP5_CHIPD|nr:hypothetical protein [Chitinophaga pinensis]ACU63848.1 hypothetical protein Cpin_6444 [Chitinophaga pinensis DSM 2588]